MPRKPNDNSPTNWTEMTIIFLTREQHCAFTREIYSKGYALHHKAKQNRMYAIGRDNEKVASIVIPYKGRYGVGFKMIIPQRHYGVADVVAYYIKENSK